MSLGSAPSLPGAEETYPLGDEVAVIKVGGRMFALMPPSDGPGSVNLKCDPARALELRDAYPGIRPGYHQNERPWNTGTSTARSSATSCAASSRIPTTWSIALGHCLDACCAHERGARFLRDDLVPTQRQALMHPASLGQGA